MDLSRLIQPYYTIRDQALDPGAIAAIRDAILDAPYMSVNNLNGRFTGTYGFSVVFRRDTVDQVTALFPAFRPYLAAALRPECNAFFLNPLLIGDGAGVKPHIDHSLHSYCPEVSFPRVVSVLYVDVPARLEGGELWLYRGRRRVAELAPRAQRLVTFRGDLRHEVRPVASGAPDIFEARISLVVEQYRVRQDLLPGVPACKVGTRRSAGAPSALADGPGEGAFGDAVREFLERSP